MLQEGDIHIALISRCNDHLKDAEIYPFGTEKIVLIALWSIPGPERFHCTC